MNKKSLGGMVLILLSIGLLGVAVIIISPAALTIRSVAVVVGVVVCVSAYLIHCIYRKGQ